MSESRAPRVCAGGSPLEVDGSSIEVYKVRCIRGCQPRYMCRNELGGGGYKFIMMPSLHPINLSKDRIMKSEVYAEMMKLLKKAT